MCKQCFDNGMTVAANMVYLDLKTRRDIALKHVHDSTQALNVVRAIDEALKMVKAKIDAGIPTIEVH